MRSYPAAYLGSSLLGAQLAAELGLPYGFASHFAPQALDKALQIYRERFKPSSQLSAPYVLVGINVVAADSDQEARQQATSQQMSFVDMFRVARQLMQPPIDDIESYWSEQEKAQASQMLACSVVGSPETVRNGIRSMIDRTNADELMIVSDIFDPEKRLRSFEIIADVNSTSP